MGRNLKEKDEISYLLQTTGNTVFVVPVLCCLFYYGLDQERIFRLFWFESENKSRNSHRLGIDVSNIDAAL